MSKNISKKENIKFASEFRYDLVSKDWVVVAVVRGHKPHLFKKIKNDKFLPQSKCPFCNLETQKTPTAIFVKGKKFLGKNIPSNWTAAAIPNKYPVVSPSMELQKKQEGKFYQTVNAVGFHEVVITRDHEKSLGLLKLKEVKELIDLYQDRHLSLKDKDFVNYISIFHNHGKAAGASIPHPHSQIITTPLIDVDLERALANSEDYYKKAGKCIYCQMSAWEKKVKKRIVFENAKFIALCPFASRSAFQVIITPKKHLSNFEKITEGEKTNLAEAFQVVMKKIHKALGDPPFNFYLHTAPCDGKNHPHYHWHWTVLPKTSIWAGFEVGTKMEILNIAPERAAEILRKA